MIGNCLCTKFGNGHGKAFELKCTSHCAICSCRSFCRAAQIRIKRSVTNQSLMCSSLQLVERFHNKEAVTADHHNAVRSVIASGSAWIVAHGRPSHNSAARSGIRRSSVEIHGSRILPATLFRLSTPGPASDAPRSHSLTWIVPVVFAARSGRTLPSLYAPTALRSPRCGSPLSPWLWTSFCRWPTTA